MLLSLFYPKTNAKTRQLCKSSLGGAWTEVVEPQLVEITCLQSSPFKAKRFLKRLTKP